jgi:hypothetical protein
MRSTFLALAAAGVLAVLVGVPAASPSTATPTLTAAQIAAFAVQAPQLQAVDAADPAPDPPSGHLMVKPREYDPAHTTLVQAEWSGATGCPNGASVAAYPATNPTGTYTDPACATSDSSDHENDGLVLVKTGPTSNNAAAFAEVKGFQKNAPLTELGYDIRKAGGSVSATGSHCGAGAPRFDVETTVDFYFVGCSSPPPDMQTVGQAWDRLRWGTGTAGSVTGFSATTSLPGPIMGNVVHIDVVFDEGTDTGPDFFGAAMLDNIDVNGILGGTGPDDPEP